MRTLAYRGKPLEVSDQGFLAKPEAWDDDVAEVLHTGACLGQR